MNKKHIAHEVSRKTGIEKKYVLMVIDALIVVIRKNVLDYHKVFFRKLGVFQLKKFKARGYNFHAKKNTEIHDIYRFNFTPSFELVQKAKTIKVKKMLRNKSGKFKPENEIDLTEDDFLRPKEVDLNEQIKFAPKPPENSEVTDSRKNKTDNSIETLKNENGDEV